MNIVPREVPPRVSFALEQAGVHPLLARLLAARGVRAADELDDSLALLLPPETLKGSAEAGVLLAEAIAQGWRICIVADYDCDGATACAVALRGLALLGAGQETLHYVVPDRAVHGYGLTPAIVELARAHRPALLVTVDNGIASHAGVAAARAAGMRVLVTDHHLPAVIDGVVSLPEADVIVNPNQPGCGFASKALAGVGVMFYVLLATRAELRRCGAFEAAAQPRLDSLLDLVALGTVADVVKLDANNRRLVAQGLKRVRGGRMAPGLAALFKAAGRDPARAAGFDFGFALGPRINAAGRLADMTLGIECLRTDDAGRATTLAAQLDAINRERREVESGMRERAEAAIEALMPTAEQAPPALALFDESFHEGVVGIVAGRVKDRLHRPIFVFARGADGRLKGSGRSIAGFHLRDALDLMAKRHPGLMLRFGGHAMAAGCTLGSADEGSGVELFDQALRQVAGEWLDAATLTRTLRSDGPLALEWFNAETVALLEAQVWGQGFEAPLFCDEVQVLQQRLVGEKHLKLRLRHAGQERDAIWFGHAEPLPASARLAFRVGLDEWNGRQRVQMMIEAAA
ncbi:Single-stranded-DNA-specific exonuclease RecJ [Rubrivivax sp. A210]|uniref:single-stranded-DNA-specific exonuclease RecJ n=1 Tax=Rubrivivax sp. A210 TaxID=2772301 RepID=UPI001918BFAC|nr:single-stranded-DNA-specific exonuclease RecJ [Rubrivivax sp. A210]CAD5374835.1 Single-stranded-DNA-specific exonuclease RecJ [Rubrivivax sp. A210]